MLKKNMRSIIAAAAVGAGLAFAPSAKAIGMGGGVLNLTSNASLGITYTLLGDANLDGKVNGTDFQILAANFDTGGNSWDQGDFTYDGKVNGSDFALLAANFNPGANSGQSAELAALNAFAADNGLSPSVPEPVSGSLLAAGAIGILSRRRRARNP